MIRHYKLANNFNTVEFEIGHDDFASVLEESEVTFLEDDTAVWDVPDEELIRRILQREYDILASIENPDIAPTKAQPKPSFEPASPKQIEWAANLGMKNPGKKSKSEVWAYIQKHR